MKFTITHSEKVGDIIRFYGVSENGTKKEIAVRNAGGAYDLCMSLPTTTREEFFA